MTQLIPDVVPLVLANLDRLDLTHCVRVCRAWLGPARQELYRSVRISEYFYYKGLLSTLTQNSHLRTLVKEVFISTDLNALNPDWIAFGDDCLVKVSGRGEIDGIDSTKLEGSPRVKEGTLAKLSGLETFALETSNDHALDQLHGRSLVRLLEKWPALQTLELTGWQFVDHDWMPQSPCTVKLAGLDLFAVRLTEAELGYLLSSSINSLRSLTYLTWDLKSFQRIIEELQVDFYGIPLPPPPPPIRLSEPALFQILAPFNLAELRVVTEDLTPTGLAKLLAASPKLRGLAIAFTSLGAGGVKGASSSLRTLQLCQLPPSGVTTEAATRRAVGHLATCFLGPVTTLTVTRIHTGLLYEGGLEVIRAIGRRRGVVVVEADRYFNSPRRVEEAARRSQAEEDE